MEDASATQNDTPSTWLFQMLGCLISWGQTMVYVPRQQIRFVEQYGPTVLARGLLCIVK